MLEEKFATMKTIYFFVLFCFLFVQNATYGQVGINTTSPDSSAVLDLVAKNNNKGLLIPRIPLTGPSDILTVPNPAMSLLVYNTTTNASISPGFYYWNGTSWMKLGDKRDALSHGTNDPAASSLHHAGDVYVNTTTGMIFTYNGTNWISQMSGSGFLTTKIIATEGQLNFTTPWNVTADRTKVYRNGVNIDFTVSGSSTIILETEAKCFANDEIKIFKFLSTKTKFAKNMKNLNLLKKSAAIAAFAIGTGFVSAQSTATSTNVNKATGAVRLIDNKGTIKYLQANNGITAITSTTAGNTTTTTWQLGGTLLDDTYIDVNGKKFALDKLKFATGAASTNATDASVHGGSGTGWTVLVRDEATGEVKKMMAADLLQVQSGEETVSVPSDASNATTYTVTGPLPTNIKNISVYRNGAKLIASTDYEVPTATAIKLKPSSSTPSDWSLHTGDVIEIQWIK